MAADDLETQFSCFARVDQQSVQTEIKKENELRNKGWKQQQT